MNVLFVHQNFPGQFKHLAPALAARGDQVLALTAKVTKVTRKQGVLLVPYRVRKGSTPDIHPWLRDFETKVARGTACFETAHALKEKGFVPDVIIAHHGWGESLFLKDVWPTARLGLYCEFYHRSEQSDIDFDPEFPVTSPKVVAPRQRLKNLNNRLHEEIMDAGITPTRFQAETFPETFQDRISVCHDGVDTDQLTANREARLKLPNGKTLTPEDEVITFANRNLEPYRGYHRFMRALPEILDRRPNAQVVIVGGDGTSYGRSPPDGTTWKQIYIDEVKPHLSEACWNRIHFLGKVPYDTFVSVLQVSSVHVYLTYPFVLSWSLLEAMSTGCAIVASDTAPVREVVHDDETGVLVDFFDQRRLCTSICDLLDDPGRRAALGRAAAAEIREHYDLKHVCCPAQIDWIDALARSEQSRPSRD